MIPNKCPGTRPAYASFPTVSNEFWWILHRANMWKQLSLRPGWVTMRLFCAQSWLQSFHSEMFRRRHFAQNKSLQIGLVWIGQTWSNYKPHQASFSAFACVCLRLSGSFSVMRTFRRTKLWPPLQKAFVNAACYLIIFHHILSYLIISYHILSLLYLIIYQQHSRDILSYHISYCPSPMCLRQQLHHLVFTQVHCWHVPFWAQPRSGRAPWSKMLPWRIWKKRIFSIGMTAKEISLQKKIAQITNRIK